VAVIKAKYLTFQQAIVPAPAQLLGADVHDNTAGEKAA
jgi:hypothetical protein